MIRDKNIICFASGWNYHPTSKHHVMRRLSEQNSVIWVNWHASRRPRLAWTDLCHMAGRLWQIRQGPRAVSDSITVVTPCQLPLPGSSAARLFNARVVSRAIKGILRRLPPRPVQIWSFAPDVAELVGRFDEELVLYYCVDAFGEFPGYDRRLIEDRERDLIARSDVIITTSPPLYENKRRLHWNVQHVEHGVDHGHLSQALRRDVPPPADLADLSRPIFGFVGVIGDWVDLGLIAGLARMRPDASIVMIGPAQQQRGPCAGLRNVHWLGPRDHRLLPDYLRWFDVGLIPFKDVPLTQAANPIKLHEYLAAGVPTVSTSLPAVRAVPNSVWLADDAQSMADCCEAARKCNSPGQRRARSESMLPESWAQRLEQISLIVERTLAHRPCSGFAPAPGRTAPEPAPELAATAT